MQTTDHLQLATSMEYCYFAMRLPPDLLSLELFVRRAWLDRELAGSNRVQQIVFAFAVAQMLTQGTVGLPTMLAQTLEQQPHFFLRSTPHAL